jgi:hypothetical protein
MSPLLKASALGKTRTRRIAHELDHHGAKDRIEEFADLKGTRDPASLRD